MFCEKPTAYASSIVVLRASVEIVGPAQAYSKLRWRLCMARHTSWTAG